jgi:hypothetical protein
MAKPSKATQHFNLDEGASEVFSNELSFTTPAKATTTYAFGSKVEAQIWADAVARRGGDPLVHVLASLPHVLPLAESAPPEVAAQLSELLAAPDMDFLHALLQAAATRGQEVSKGAVLAALARIAAAGLLAPWFRAVFSIEIQQLRSAQTIFRESSAASISSGVFLVCLGSEFSKLVAGILLENAATIDAGIRKIVAAIDRVPPALRIVFGACFRATRRRFQEKLVPIMAVSSFLMLRFLLPQFAIISPAASKLGQKLMAVFVFRKIPDDYIGEDIPQLIGDFLLKIGEVEDAQVQLPQYDGRKILQFCAENAMLVTDRLELVKGGDEYPLHWSLLELLETAIFGIKEDYARILDGHAYVL